MIKQPKKLNTLLKVWKHILSVHILSPASTEITVAHLISVGGHYYLLKKYGNRNLEIIVNFPRRREKNVMAKKRGF